MKQVNAGPSFWWYNGPMKQHVIWSVDAFPDQRKLQANMIAFLRAFSKNIETTVQPVYVLSPDQLNLPMDFSQPWISEFLPSAQKALQHLLSKVKLRGLQTPQVLVQSSPSVKRSIEKMIEHARGSQADLICLGTHARKGISRWMLGSFAESLVHQSPIPVFILSPDTRVAPQFKKILFPTDFSDASMKAWNRVLPLAKQLGSKVVLFHKLPHPAEPVFQSGVYLLGGAWIPIGDFLSNEKERVRKESQRWIGVARDHGVNAESVLHEGRGGIADAIVAACKKQSVQMLAMAAESGTVATLLMGSVARQTLRKAPCPVWMLKT